MNSEEIKRNLYNSKVNKYQFLAQLKYDSNYKEFQKAKNVLRTHPLGRHALESNPLPKKLSEIRKNNIVPHSGNLEAEISWILYAIDLHKRKIKKFLDLKYQFEKELLLENFDNAEKILDEIDTSICVSNWGMDSRLILEESRNGTEQNWLLLKEFSSKIKDPLALFLVGQSSKKTEKKLSYARYKTNFEAVTSGLDNLLNEYLSFKLLYPGFTGFNNYSFIINVESVSSVIDRYLILVDVLSEIITKDRRELVKKVIKELNPQSFNDSSIFQLKNLCSDTKLELSSCSDLLEYINKYTIGEYSYCIEESERFFKTYPSSIEPYLIYVKSLIELGMEYKEISFSEMMNDISKKLFDVYGKTPNYDISLADLIKISLNLFSFKLGKQLFSVISGILNLTDENENHRILYSINSEILNPILIYDIHKLPQELQTQFWSNVSLKVLNSKSYELNNWIANGDFGKIQKDVEVSTKRKSVYVSRAISEGGDYKHLISYIKALDNYSSLSINSKWELIILLFNAYLKLEEYSEALDLYVDQYFINKSLVSNLNANRILEKITSQEFDKHNINIPIFFSIVSPDIYEQFVKYDDFMEEIGMERPTELVSNNTIPQTKLIYFLKEICTLEVMHHSLNFEGTDDIETERVNILLHLLKIDSDLETSYIEEITEINQRSKIRKAIREVNKGRITINSQLLQNSVENEIKDNFLRFKELMDFSDEHDLKAIDPTSKLLSSYFSALQDKNLRDKFVSVSDPAFISFKAMVVDLRDKFILSKDFGLDGYLSTRIRHGTFLNHVRSVFERLHLINQKKEDEYLVNEYWNNKIPYSLKDKKEEIQTSMKKFSKEIDDLTEYIIKELIQIKTEKHQQKKYALFDYSLDPGTQLYLYAQLKGSLNSHSVFLNKIFKYLEGITRHQLEKIRRIFKDVLSNEYTQIIKNFEEDISNILGDRLFVDLTNSIKNCQTNIQNEIINIAEWFSISNPSSELVLDLSTIVKTALEITNTIYPNQTLQPKISVGNDISFAKGNTNMIYIMRILLDNIIKHSHLPVQERDITVESKLLNRNSMILKVSNDFNPEYLDSIRLDLSETKRKWNEEKRDFANSNIEGGSGFDKIRRILAVDMNMNQYDFDFEITENRVTIELILQVNFQLKMTA